MVCSNEKRVVVVCSNEKQVVVVCSNEKQVHNAEKLFDSNSTFCE